MTNFSNCDLLVWCFTKPYINYFLEILITTGNGIIRLILDKKKENTTIQLWIIFVPSTQSLWQMDQLDHKYHNIPFLTIEIQKTPITRELWITTIYGSKRLFIWLSEEPKQIGGSILQCYECHRIAPSWKLRLA